MFKRVDIYRYRTCIDVSIGELPFMTALVGRNGAGKTSILRAIRWLAAVGSGNFKPGPAHAFDERDVEAEIELDGVTFSYRVSVQLSEARSIQLHEALSWTTGGVNKCQIDRSNGRLSASFLPQDFAIENSTSAVAFVVTLFPDSSAASTLTKLQQFLASVRYYGMDEVQYTRHQENPIVLTDTYKQWRSDEASPDEPDVPLKLIHLHEESPDAFAELKEYLGKNGLGIVSDITIHHVDQSDSEGFPSFYLINFSLAPRIKSPLSFYQLSAGTRRALNLITAMIHDHSSVMLLEHPEDSIHDALLTKLLLVIKTNTDPSQVFFTSHSATAMNLLDLDEVRLVSIEDGNSSVRSLTAVERDAACRFVAEEGPFSDFLESVQD